MRRLFRIHLSTAIVLMLLASAFLGANLLWSKTSVGGLVEIRGWPWSWELRIFRDGSSALRDLDIGSVAETERHPGDSVDTLQVKRALSFKYHNRYWRIAGNAGVALAAMTAVAAVMEWRLRRSKKL